MAWERIALHEVATSVAEIQSVPAGVVAWVAAVVWLYAPYPRELQEAWTAASAAVAKLERELMQRRDDWEAVEACRQLLRLYVPERGERIRVQRERRPDGSELVGPVYGADEFLNGRPKPDRTRFLVALVEVLKERGALSKQRAFSVVSELWPHVIGDRMSAESASRQYWRAVERYRETGLVAPVNLSEVDAIANRLEKVRADANTNNPKAAETTGYAAEPEELPQEEWQEMPSGVPKWALTIAQTGRPPTMREMGFELDPSMEAYMDALLRGESPSTEMIKLPEDVAERVKANPAERSEAVDTSEPKPDPDGEKPPSGGAEGTDN